MKKDLLVRANKLTDDSLTNALRYGGTLYFTKNPINNDARFKNKKYFLCYHNTHTIKHSFKTQTELSEFLAGFGF